jgi:RNA polymerase sigma-70 factor (ECF subfamily)
MQIARRKARFEGRSAVRTWLIGIAANMVRHHRRSFARRRKLAGALRADRAGAGTLPPAADADVRRRLLAARDALEALPEELRLAFVLCELEGLSAREAAEALRTSEAAVWKRVSRARAQIRAAVESEGSRDAM